MKNTRKAYRTLESIRFKGYRAFKDWNELETKPITLLFGKNSTGKSSIMHLRTVLLSLLYSKNLSADEVSFPTGHEIKYDNVNDLVTDKDYRDFTFEWKNEWLDETRTSDDNSFPFHKLKISTTFGVLPFNKEDSKKFSNNVDKLEADAIKFHLIKSINVIAMGEWVCKIKPLTNEQIKSLRTDNSGQLKDKGLYGLVQKTSEERELLKIDFWLGGVDIKLPPNSSSDLLNHNQKPSFYLAAKVTSFGSDSLGISKFEEICREVVDTESFSRNKKNRSEIAISVLKPFWKDLFTFPYRAEQMVNWEQEGRIDLPGKTQQTMSSNEENKRLENVTELLKLLLIEDMYTCWREKDNFLSRNRDKTGLLEKLLGYAPVEYLEEQKRVDLLMPFNKWMIKLSSTEKYQIKLQSETSPDGLRVIEKLWSSNDDYFNKKLKQMVDKKYAINYWELLRRDSNFSVSLNEVGSGIAQVLPILKVGAMDSDKTNMVEQPELHLHPGQQAEMGKFIIDSYKRRNNNWVLETHSEHIILTMQLEVAKWYASKGKEGLHPDDLAIYYVSQDEEGVSSLKKIELDETGSFKEPWPDDFFEAAGNLTYERLKQFRTN